MMAELQAHRERPQAGEEPLASQVNTVHAHKGTKLWPLQLRAIHREGGALVGQIVREVAHC